MDWLVQLLVAWFNIDSETARIVASASMGVVLIVISVGSAMAAYELSKGGRSLLTSTGKSGENLTEAAKIGVANTSTGVQSLLSTPETYIKTAGQVAISRIQASKQGGRAYAKDQLGNEAGVEVTGDGSLDVLANVVDSLGHVTGKVIPPAYARMITQNNNGEVE